MARSIFATVYHHAETAVDNFAPTYAASVVDAHPGGTAETIANDVLNSHVGAELRAVVNVACFAEGGVCSRHIVMVSTEHHRPSQFSALHGFVECQRNLHSSFTIGVENACL